MGGELQLGRGLAPESRLATRGGARPTQAGRARARGWTRRAPPSGPAGRNPDNATASPHGSAVARPDSSGHAAGAGRPRPRRSTAVGQAEDGDGRGSDRTDNAGAAELGASITSQRKATPYPMRTASAQDGCEEVSWTEPRQASAEGELPDERSLTVTTPVMLRCDDIESVAARKQQDPGSRLVQGKTAGMNRF